HRNQCFVQRGLFLNCSTGWRIFAERIVNPILVMIGHILANQPTKMPFVQGDNVVQEFPAATAHPSGSSILPRRLNTRPLGLQARRLQKGDDRSVELESRSRMT